MLQISQNGTAYSTGLKYRLLYARYVSGISWFVYTIIVWLNESISVSELLLIFARGYIVSSAGEYRPSVFSVTFIAFLGKTECSCQRKWSSKQ
ncbi:hypothetical protein DDR33_08290 [Pararcticibacter amylolyticus]|uniref:Uncharacterized protein n=1 Tax=Pararcticibacter amylolyticus TaxID=2173175 RepID=A0A2U2PI42_9SPHI|nr:hypothetical protein DDR33_08290 [Pararcticibacter amylolyticus]